MSRENKNVVSQRQIYRRIANEVRFFSKNLETEANTVSQNAHAVVPIQDNLDSRFDELSSASDDPSEHPSLQEFNLEINYAENLLNPEIFHETNQNINFCLRTDLRKWAIENKVPHNIINSLLLCLNKFHPELPRDSRTLLKTPLKTIYKELNNGNYYHYGLGNNLSQFILKNPLYEFDEFNISFNIDGLPLFKSSNEQFWPILGNLKNENVISDPFVIGIFAGKSKPLPLHDFLQDFVNELVDFLENGFIYNGVKYKILIHSFICDAPARSFIKCTKSHGGYSSCERCTEVGDYIDGRVVLVGINAPKRTDESFRLQLDDEHHTGLSPLAVLNVDLVKKFPLDYMHCVCLGVMRKMLLSWVGGSLNVRFKAQCVNEISQILIGLKDYIPKEFNRKPRSLRELSNWKATEFRTFLLYIGPFVLQKIDKSIYEHFLLLHYGVSILVSLRHIDKYGYDVAQEILNQFVIHSKKIYGKQYSVYNIHILCHLTDDVRTYGPLDTISAFKFENFLGNLKKMIRSPSNTIQQIHRRLVEFQELSHKITICKNSNISLFMQHQNGPVIDLNCSYITQYKKIFYNSFEYSIYSYSCANCYFLTKNGYIFKIQNIIQMPQNEVIFIGKKFIQPYRPLYEYPFSSQNLDIYVVNSLSEITTCSLKNVVTKCMLFPLNTNCFAAFPLLHSF